MLLELTSRVERKVAGSTVVLTLKDKWSSGLWNDHLDYEFICKFQISAGKAYLTVSCIEKTRQFAVVGKGLQREQLFLASF